MPFSATSQRLERLTLSLLDPAQRRQLGAPAGLFSTSLPSLSDLHRQDPPLQQRLQQTLDWLRADDCHLLLPEDPDYPSALAAIADPPAQLYVQGNLQLLQDPQLAMVGTRHPTPRGAATAREFARAFSEAGLCITSGMALGVDAACHQGALDVSAPTVAVWGTGLLNCYPRRHQKLARQIVECGGALVSEVPLQTAAHPGVFPRRNRIISGLSLGCLVVEASLDSGSLITARLALEQNREVFAMPGSIHNPMARGCHQLLREGAQLVECVADVLQSLRLPLQQALQQDSAPAPADPLLAWLDCAPVSADWLSSRSGLPIEQVLQRLLQLELDGLVQSLAGGYCRR